MADDSLRILSSPPEKASDSTNSSSAGDGSRPPTPSPRPLPDPTGPGQRPDDEVPPCFVPEPGDHPLNDKYLFLSEIGGVSCLRPFLKKLFAANEQGNTDYRHWGCTLVIDQQVLLFSPLRLPGHFTLAGLGPHGPGALVFKNLQPGEPGVFVPQGDGLVGYTTIRDIRIENLTPNLEAGVRIDVGDVRLSNTSVRGFWMGVHGRTSSNVIVSNCILAQNRTNLALEGGCDGWRIRDCDILESTEGWGIDIRPRVVGLLIEGCRVINNAAGGIRIWYVKPGEVIFGVVIMGNLFDQNPGGEDSIGVWVGEGVWSTRLLYNNLVDDRVVPETASPAKQHDTQIALNSSTKEVDEVMRALNLP